jgi:hypothetical protein
VQLIQHTLIVANTVNNVSTTGITSVITLFNMAKDAMNLWMLLRKSKTTSHERKRHNLRPRARMRRPTRRIMKIA